MQWKSYLVVAVFLACCLLAVTVGAFDVDLLGVLSGEATPVQERVLSNIRMPRVLLAALVGGSLALSGAALQGLQVAATVTSTWALVPQCVRNMRSRSKGGWSVWSGTIATAANAARIFTTLALADANVLLLVQFSARCCLNAVLLVQSLVWA